MLETQRFLVKIVFSRVKVSFYLLKEYAFLLCNFVMKTLYVIYEARNYFVDSFVNYSSVSTKDSYK